MCAQIHVGGMLKKSYMRFIGTLSGSLIALMTLHFFGENDIAVALAIAISAVLFSYIATGEKSYSEAGTLGVVTVVIILMSPNPTFIVAFERFIEITLGIIIAALVSQFVLPILARDNLRANQASTLRKLSVYYLAALTSSSSIETLNSYQVLDEDIAKSLVKQRKLAADSMPELFGEKFYLYDFKKLLFAEKEILRAISAMQYAYKSSVAMQKLFANTDVLKTFHHAVTHTLDKVANNIETHEVDKDSIHLPEIAALEYFIYAEVKKLQNEDAMYFYVFLFAAEQIVSQLTGILKLLYKS
jgi:uncharacterized membrane protein YccC